VSYFTHLLSQDSLSTSLALPQVDAVGTSNSTNVDPRLPVRVRTAALKRIEAALVEAGISFAGAGPQTILVRRAPDP